MTYLGIDIGSISTNVVALDEGGTLLSKRYLMTASRPIEAVRRGIREVGDEIGRDVKILGVFDVNRNEEFLPDVPTLKEQGFDVDDSSVNFRGIMVPKGTPQAVIDKLAERVPAMFENARVKKQMALDARRRAAGRSPALAGRQRAFGHRPVYAGQSFGRGGQDLADGVGRALSRP